MEQLGPLTGPSAPFRWIDLAPWPVHLTDHQGTPCGANAEVARLLGMSPGAIDQEVWAQCLPPTTRTRLANAARALTEQDAPYRELSLHYRHHQGGEIRVPRARLTRANDAGDLLAVMLVEVSSPALFDPHKIRTRLIRLMSHDFNNAFTIAGSYLEMARRRETNDEQRSTYLNRSREAIRRSVRINEHLQSVIAKGPFATEPVAIAEVIPVLQSYLPRLFYPGPRWNFEQNSRLPRVKSHHMVLTRFALDLCLNAYARWPQSATLTLELRPSSDRSSAIVARITPSSDSPSAPPLPFVHYLTHQTAAGLALDQPILMEEIVDDQPVAIDLGRDAIHALVPAL